MSERVQVGQNSNLQGKTFKEPSSSSVGSEIEASPSSTVNSDSSIVTSELSSESMNLAAGLSIESNELKSDSGFIDRLVSRIGKLQFGLMHASQLIASGIYDLVEVSLFPIEDLASYLLGREVRISNPLKLLGYNVFRGGAGAYVLVTDDQFNSTRKLLQSNLDFVNAFDAPRSSSLVLLKRLLENSLGSIEGAPEHAPKKYQDTAGFEFHTSFHNAYYYSIRPAKKSGQLASPEVEDDHWAAELLSWMAKSSFMLKVRVPGKQYTYNDKYPAHDAELAYVSTESLLKNFSGDRISKFVVAANVGEGMQVAWSNRNDWVPQYRFCQLAAEYLSSTEIASEQQAIAAIRVIGEIYQAHCS